MSKKRSLDDANRNGDTATEEEGDPYSNDLDRDYILNIRPDDNHIWLDGKCIVRPTKSSISYGILMYKLDEENNNSKFKYLLGLIPQRNAWTVFKGMPDVGETPQQTAIREFTEETSLPFPYPEEEFQNKVTTTLFGKTSKKLLEIYLVEAPANFSIAGFDIDRVIKIDGEYMKGQPEIVDIQFLTKDEAVNGTTVTTSKGERNVTVYKSQKGIIEHADVFLRGRQRQAKNTTKDSDYSK